MTRAYDEWVAAVFDVVSPPVVLLVLIFGSMLVSALWYWYPAWVPRRLPRWRRVARAPRTAKKVTADEVITAAEPDPEPLAGDGEPPPGLADRLAAEGRYAEAIRQRLRETVRDLVLAGVMTPQPGWTVTELAAVAAAQRPDTAGPFTAATELFSAVWYAARPAGREQDERMRALTDEVRGRTVFR